MGTISRGILGGFSGTVGNVIGGTWKGINYMRSRMKTRSHKGSQAQLAQRAKFALGSSFVHSFNDLFMVSFSNFALKMTGTNNALSYLLKNAITGTFPNYSILYQNVLVSRGELPNALNPTTIAQAGNNLKFVWTNNSGTGKAKPGDKTILVLYCPGKKMAIYKIGTATRLDEKVVLNAYIFSGELVHAYIGFISEDGKDIADSIYTGEMIVRN